MMNVHKTELDGVLIIEQNVFGDKRGYFMETYQRQRYADAGIVADFVQDNLSFSKKGTLRAKRASLSVSPVPGETGAGDSGQGI